MLTSECERDIQLELNRNYLKSFPARLKFCHIFLNMLSAFLLMYLAMWYYWLTWMPIAIQCSLALCSLIFLVSSTINWKTSGKICMARISFIYHTTAIVLLIVSTGIILIGLAVRLINDDNFFRRHVPLCVSIFITSILNLLNGLLYYTSIKLVRTTCENY